MYYKSDKFDELREIVSREVNTKEAKRRRPPTTSEKSNTKDLEQRTGGQRWGSCLFAWLG